MGKKISWRYTTSWGSIIGVSLILLFTLGFYLFPAIKAYQREIRSENYKGITTAKILEIKDNKYFAQDRYGNREKIISVTVKYSYFALDKVYVRSQHFSPRDWYSTIRSLDSLGNTQPYRVKFDIENPSKSVLILKSNISR